MRKELPLKHIEEPKKLTEGSTSEVFEFKPEKGKEYVFKEIRERSWLKENYPEETLEKKASAMKKVYDVFREYYGNKIVKTNYIVAKNKEGRPCIMVVQEKVKGTRLDKLSPNNPRCQKAWKQLAKINEMIPSVEKDPRLANLKVGSYEIVCSINVFVDKKGNITIVDW